MGQLRNKCVLEVPSSANWTYFVQNSSNWFYVNGEPELCGNASGARYPLYANTRVKCGISLCILVGISIPVLKCVLAKLNKYDFANLFCKILTISVFRSCPHGFVCLHSIGENPNYGFTSFDNLLWSMLTTFQLITLDYWEDVYNMVIISSSDTTNIGVS